MPPRLKFTKEEIAEAALALVRKSGINALTARGLGEALGTSSRPVFTAFRNMEELREKVILAARSVYNGYMDKIFAQNGTFGDVGMQYFRFAKEEPRLFELLFMTPGETDYSLDDVLPSIDDNSDRILKSIQEPYGLSRDDSYKVYQSLWIFTHGIACLSVTGVSNLSYGEAAVLMKDVFTGLIMKIKKGKNKYD